MNASNETKLMYEYCDSIGRGDVTNRDMSFHMKFEAAKLGYPSRNIPLDRIDTHPNRSGGACAMKLVVFDDESIRKWEYGCRCQMLYLNTLNRIYWGYIKGWKPK